MVNVIDGVNGVLEKAQQAMYVASFVATGEIVQNVVEANDDRFFTDTVYGIASAVENLRAWESFTHQYPDDEQAGLTRRADVINRSLDDFSANRSWKFFRFWLPITPISLARIEREGTTRLIQVNSDEGPRWEWKAKDTVSLNTKIWRPFRGFHRIEAPIGWGEAYSNLDSSRSIEPCDEVHAFGGIQPCTRWFRRNKWAEFSADHGILNSRERLNASFHGIRAYRALTEAIAAEDDPRLTLRVEVGLPVSAISNASTSRLSGRFSTLMTAPGEVMSSVSNAEVFYRRPDEDPGSPVENATAYNPFWDVRLRSVSLAERLAAMALRPSGSIAIAPGHLQQESQLSSYSEVEAVNAESATAQEQITLRPDEYISADVGQIAGSLGLNTSSVQQIIVSQLPYVNGNTLQAYVEQQVGSQLDAVTDVLRDELENELVDAAQRLLSGAVEATIGDSIQAGISHAEDIQQQVQNGITEQLTWIDDAESQLATAIALGQAEVDRVTAEFSQIRDTVANNFEQARVQVGRAHEQHLDALAIRLEQLQADVLDPSLTSLREQIQVDISQINDQLRDQASDLEHNLAQALVDIVDDATDIIDLQFSVALDIVRAGSPHRR